MARRSRMQTRQAAQSLLVWTGGGLLVLGCLLGLLAPPALGPIVLAGLLAGGLLGLALGAWVAVPGPPEEAQTVVQIRALDALPTPVKVLSILARLLALVAGALLGLSILTRAGAVHFSVAGDALQRGVFVMVLALAASLVYVQSYTLRRVALRAPGRAARAVQAVAIVLAAAAALVALWLAAQPDPAARTALALHGQDFPFVALGGMVALAVALAGGGSLPSLSMVAGTTGRATTRTGGQGRFVLLPVILAFVLLFLVVLLLLLFGVGVAGVLEEVQRSPTIVGLVVFVVVVFAAAIVAALRLARSEAKEPPLYKQAIDVKKRRERTITIASALGAAVLLIPAALLFQGFNILGFGPDTWVHFLCLGLLVGLGPYGFYMAHEHRRIRLLEERFPDFLRDVASSHKGGLTLAQSVAVAARGEYGPLSPEVQRMADQLSWNVPFNEALDRFGGRVQTPLVQRAVNLILEANRSGGATTDVLLAAARDAREIKFLEQDRRVNMSLYTVVIYVTFFVFLGVTAILYSQFVPQLVASSKAAQEVAAAGGQAITGVTSANLELRDFQLFYFMAALMQGLGDGIVAGLMGTGKAVLGLRHAFTMVALSYVTFVFLIV